MMITVIKDWYIVRIIDSGLYVATVLWGTCVEDMTSRFSAGDYVCSSKIVSIDPMAKMVKTQSGSSYQVEGDGIRTDIQLNDFELLRQGFSPEVINQLRDYEN